MSHWADRLFREQADLFAESFEDVFDATGEGYDYVDTVEWENRLYAPPVLRELCESAGFETVSLFGGFDGGVLTLESERVVALAR